MRIVQTMLAAAIVLAGSGLASAMAEDAPPPPVAAGCATSDIQLIYNQAVGAFTGQNGAAKDLGKAKTLLDGVITRCGAANVTFLPRILRADIAMQDKDDEAAFAALSPVPRPGRGSLGIHSSFMMLKLLAARNDPAAFAAERSSLVAASASLMTSAPVNGQLIETFTAPGGDKVAAFKLTLNQGSFIRHYEFLIQPAGSLAMPVTMALSTDSIDLKLPGMENTKVYFLDRYSCPGHETIQQIATSGPIPDYMMVKDRVLAALAGTAKPVSGTTPPKSSGCAFESYMAPGL